MRNRIKSSQVNPATTRLIRQALRSHDFSSRENKYFTTSSSGTMAQAGVVWAITQGIIQGDTIEQREGMQINVTRLRVRFTALVNGVNNNARVIIFKDLHSRGAVPNVTDVLDSAVVSSGYNVYYKQANRFKILVDESIPITTGGSNSAVTKCWDLKQKSTKVSFLGGTDVSTANGPNAYYMIVLCEISTTPPTYTFGFEVNYFDS